jgi:hypothetical protein
MALAFIYYGTLSEANDYFDHRLHEEAWSGADTELREKALWAATQIIDTLNFKGNKATVHTLLTATPDATEQQIRDAEAAQVREFPRGNDTDVPEAIRTACYDIAHDLLDGKDPEIELENLGITSQAYSSVRTTYHRSQVPIEHIVNGIPNALAWRKLRPFLRDGELITLKRIS